MVHKPKHKVHSFRGLLGSGGEDEINLERQNVNMAYRITKFQGIGTEPGETVMEHTLKIYREEQTSINNTVDFSDVDLLAVAYITDNAGRQLDVGSAVIFDNTLFSRNIFVTQVDTVGDPATSCNYYIEIEEVPVGAATLMQLKLQVARKLSLSQD